jgi:ergothioneine biosynthesis protein EgtB
MASVPGGNVEHQRLFSMVTPLDDAASDRLRGPSSSLGQPHLAERFRHVRAATRRLAAPLSAEDMVPQSMPDASPVKWHLAHTSWFFETFILLPHGERAFDPAFQYLFNSYYEALGRRHPRNQRGLVTRPGVAEVMAYRDHVDQRVAALLESGDGPAGLGGLVALGLAHEEQHQELLLTDLLHLLGQNPLSPAYHAAPAHPPGEAAPLSFSAFEGGVVEVGHDGAGFAFDNEGPRHSVLLRPFELADRLVTAGEWLAFMEDGGYRRPELWLSDGWAQRQADGWTAPMYWEEGDGGWSAFGFSGLQPVRRNAPVTQVSFYEADAYARWCGARLPLEHEWEHAAARAGARGGWMDDGEFTARPAARGPLAQMFGDAWEWTASPYVGYPGYAPAAGAVGEYNGKFMINQMVLRGGSCLTPAGHVRASYRNFFQPHQRWQMSGLRLARG